MEDYDEAFQKSLRPPESLTLEDPQMKLIQSIKADTKKALRAVADGMVKVAAFSLIVSLYLCCLIQLSWEKIKADPKKTKEK
jgi:hypothetical protein